MVIPHDWRECRPAVLALDGQEHFDAELVVETVWSGLTDFERQAWHRVCCFNSRDLLDMAVAQKVVNAVKERRS